MEALTPAFLRTINEKIPANASVNASFANSIFGYYQKEGLLRQDIKKPTGGLRIILSCSTAVAPYRRESAN